MAESRGLTQHGAELLAKRLAGVQGTKRKREAAASFMANTGAMNAADIRKTFGPDRNR